MIVILGGGLAGLSTAYHLGDLPHVVLEADAVAGGLCRSRTVDGFVFDYTGHLLHLRDPRAEKLVAELLPEAFRVIERRAAIRTHGATLPFPFQANLHGLPPEIVAECIIGFVECGETPIPDDPAVSFRDWSLAVLGRGISDQISRFSGIVNKVVHHPGSRLGKVVQFPFIGPDRLDGPSCPVLIRR